MSQPQLFPQDEPAKPIAKDVRYWRQTGRNFLLFDTEAAAKANNPMLAHEPVMWVTYPADVMVDETAAMRWFIDEWCKEHLIIPVCCMEDK